MLHAEKMVSLGRLVAGVAHELNNPISFVLGNVLSLKRYASRLESYLSAVHASDAAEDEASPGRCARNCASTAPGSDMPHLIDGMIEGAERTRDIVDALKRFSAVDKATPEQVNLNEVVERSVRWVVQSASAKFAVRIDLPPDLRCCGSSGQLQQVVMNLVQNACDATARQAEPRLTVCGGIEQGRAVLHFIDNGPGIPEENLSRLFEPFFTTKPVGQEPGSVCRSATASLTVMAGSSAPATSPVAERNSSLHFRWKVPDHFSVSLPPRRSRILLEQ